MSPLPPTVSGSGPLLGHAREFLRSPETVLRRGYDEHGKIFRLRLPGPPGIVLLGPEHSKFVFAETDKRLSIRRAYPFFVHMFGADGYFLADEAEYKRQRDIVLPRFQARQMESHVEIMDALTGELIEQLGDAGEVDLVTTMGPHVMNVATQCFLGSDLSGRLGRSFFEVFRQFSEGMDPLIPGWVPVPKMVRCHRARDELRRVIGDVIRERRAHPLEPADFLQVLSEARYADGEPVPEHRIVNLVLMMIWVGYETTNAHLGWSLIDLLQNPHELDKVLDEQRTVLDPSEPLTVKKLHRLPVLDRAVHETERLHPVTVVIARKAVETIEYAGYRIPKGAVVMVPPALTHRLPDVFPDPDRFHPDRYIDDPKAQRLLVGFGGGLHRCLGAQFAYQEIKLTVTRLLQHFDLELLDRHPVPAAGQTTKWPQSPCRVRYRRKVGAVRPS
jgi:sterol 14alpha-demethylase